MARSYRCSTPLVQTRRFAVRAGVQNPPGKCFGWGGWIPGSEAGAALMGMGNALRWTDNAPNLAANAAQILSGIANYSQPNGWLFAFNESLISADNLPDYCAGWVTRGLLALAGQGDFPEALALARGQISVFNNHSLLPTFLPPNGGPNPVQPYPSECVPHCLSWFLHASAELVGKMLRVAVCCTDWLYGRIEALLQYTHTHTHTRTHTHTHTHTHTQYIRI
jgi:hypothetical protein